MRLSVFFFVIILFYSQGVFSQVGINTITPNIPGVENVALDVNGKVLIQDFDSPDNSEGVRYLGVSNDGVLVKLTGDPTNVSFFQSQTANKYTGTDVTNLNSGKNFVIPWSSASDVVINKLMTIDSADQSFIFNESGMYEISGVLNFGINMGSGYVADASHRVAINVSVQYQRNATSTWVDLTATRMLFVAGMLDSSYTSITIITPQTLFKFEPGDRIRMIVNKPFGQTFTAFEIAKPTGTTISKQLKIVLL